MHVKLYEKCCRCEAICGPESPERLTVPGVARGGVVGGHFELIFPLPILKRSHGEVELSYEPEKNSQGDCIERS